MANEDERRRRRDEQVQDEVLGGLQRILDVLHDISDGIREVQVVVREERRSSVAPEPTGSPQSLLLSIDEAAELTGIKSSSFRRLCDASHGPSTVRIGRRIFVQRSDLERWLDDARSEQRGGPVRRSERVTPGRIGASVSKSVSGVDTPWCPGSHSEPRAASEYSGRGVCRSCGDDVLINRSGLLRKHRPWRW